LYVYFKLYIIKMTVKVKINDTDGNLLQEFIGEDDKSFHVMAEEAKVDIPIACGAGACLVCAVRVIEGMEYVQPDKIQAPLVETEEDQILTCISGIKTEALESDEEYTIVLQKIL